MVTVSPKGARTAKIVMGFFALLAIAVGVYAVALGTEDDAKPPAACSNQ